MVDIEKLTNYSQELLNSASICMNRNKNNQIQPEHIMMAMIEDKGAIRTYLDALKLLNEDFIKAVAYQISTFPTLSVPPTGTQIYLSDDTKKLLNISEKLKYRLAKASKSSFGS